MNDEGMEGDFHPFFLPVKKAVRDEVRVFQRLNRMKTQPSSIDPQSRLLARPRRPGSGDAWCAKALSRSSRSPDNGMEVRPASSYVSTMTDLVSQRQRAGCIRFKAKLLRPLAPKSASWFFLVLPASASAKLPTRGMTAVEGTLEGQPFKATLEPDGQGSHWLKVTRALRQKAGAAVGDTVRVEMVPATEQPEPRVPADLRKALLADPEARVQWSSLTPVARRDWIQWITTAKQASTRERRIANTRDMLNSGKRRVCCFDRSAIYSKGFGAPVPR